MVEYFWPNWWEWWLTIAITTNTILNMVVFFKGRIYIKKK